MSRGSAEIVLTMPICTQQSREIALYEADVKMILGMGTDAIENLKRTLDKVNAGLL
jgi:hypothetical protein